MRRAGPWLFIALAVSAGSALWAQESAGEPTVVKLYRKAILREAVFFDNREADLEKHAFRSGGQLYITLTDLMRHLGGTIIWGPADQYILVERGGIAVRVFPGSARVQVNGQARSLGRPALRLNNRTYVPVQAMLRLFGLGPAEWNRLEQRLYVNTGGGNDEG